MGSVGERELFAFEFLKSDRARNRPGHNAVNRPGVDQKFDFDRAPPPPPRADLCGSESNSHLFRLCFWWAVPGSNRRPAD